MRSKTHVPLWGRTQTPMDFILGLTEEAKEIVVEALQETLPSYLQDLPLDDFLELRPIRDRSRWTVVESVTCDAGGLITDREYKTASFSAVPRWKGKPLVAATLDFDWEEGDLGDLSSWDRDLLVAAISGTETPDRGGFQEEMEL